MIGLSGGGGGGSLNVDCQLKFYYFVCCWLEFSTLVGFVGKSQLNFLSLVGNFFLVLSEVTNIFLPFVANQLTPNTPCVVFLGKKLYPCSASLQPSVKWVHVDHFNAGGNPVMD